MSRRSRRARAPPAHPAPPPRPSSPDASGPRAAAASRPLPRGSPVSRKSCPVAPPSCRPRAPRPPARAAPPSPPFLGPDASHIPRLARPARGSHPPRAAPRETRARSSRAAGVGAGIRSPGRSLLEDQSDGSVIHELHLHHCSELSRGDLHPAPCSPLPHERDKAVVERNRNIGRRRVDETGTPALLHVAVQRELGHHQHGPVHVRERKVHLAVGVPEHAQAEQLVRHPGERVARVRGREPREDEKPHPDRSRDAAIHPDRRTGYALNDYPHATPPHPMADCGLAIADWTGVLRIRNPKSAIRNCLTRPSRSSPGCAADPRYSPGAPRYSTPGAAAAARSARGSAN